MVLPWGKRAEELGYDSLWVADHLMLGKDEAILEGWTVLSALAGATTRVKLGHDPHGALFPAPGADRQDGRHARPALGRPAHPLSRLRLPAAGVRQLRLAVARGHGRSHRRSGRSDRADPAALGRRGPADVPRPDLGGERTPSAAPKPLQQPHPPLWFGEAAPGGLAACARYGQGWNTTPVPLPELRAPASGCFARRARRPGGTWPRSS